MKKSYSHWFAEGLMFMVLVFGLAMMAHAQDSNQGSETKKTVKVEVEITENGKTSTSIQELELNKESINGQLDEMVEEIEMILEEAVQDIEETDLQITIRRNMNGTQQPRYRQNYRFNHDYEAMGPAFEPENRPYLGVYLQTADSDDMAETEAEHGVEITGLISGGAAEANGLEEGDIITSIGGVEVGTYNEAVRAIRSHDIGEVVVVEYIRDGESQQMEVPLGQHRTQISQNQSANRPFLGVVSAANYDGEVAKGVVLTNIVEGSGAQKAGLQEGDIVLSLDGASVQSHGQLTRAILSHEPGDEVELEVIRDGQPQRISATLGQQSHGAHVYGNGYNYNYNYNHNHNHNHACGEDMEDLEELAKKPFLGVAIHNASDQGVEVDEVYSETTADKLGLKEGDIIRKINGEKVNTMEELIAELANLEVGDEVKVEFRRDGKKERVTGKIGNKADYCKHKEQRMTENGGSVIRMRLTVEEDEIANLSEKSGEELDTDNSLEVSDFSYSPNPTNGPVRLQFDLPEAGDLSIMVFDGNGRKVFEQEIIDFRGSYSGEVDLSPEPAGTYFIALTQNGAGKVVRLIKQ